MTSHPLTWVREFGPEFYDIGGDWSVFERGSFYRRADGAGIESVFIVEPCPLDALDNIDDGDLEALAEVRYGITERVEFARDDAHRENGGEIEYIPGHALYDLPGAKAACERMAAVDQSSWFSYVDSLSNQPTPMEG